MTLLLYHYKKASKTLVEEGFMSFSVEKASIVREEIIFLQCLICSCCCSYPWFASILLTDVLLVGVFVVAYPL
jgi:hypothetical protein